MHPNPLYSCRKVAQRATRNFALETVLAATGMAGSESRTGGAAPEADVLEPPRPAGAEAASGEDEGDGEGDGGDGDGDGDDMPLPESAGHSMEGLFGEIFRSIIGGASTSTQCTEPLCRLLDSNLRRYPPQMAAGMAGATGGPPGARGHGHGGPALMLPMPLAFSGMVPFGMIPFARVGLSMPPGMVEVMRAQEMMRAQAPHCEHCRGHSSRCACTHSCARPSASRCFAHCGKCLQKRLPRRNRPPCPNLAQRRAVWQPTPFHRPLPRRARGLRLPCVVRAPRDIIALFLARASHRWARLVPRRPAVGRGVFLVDRARARSGRARG